MELHKSKWHKICRNEFLELKIERHENQKKNGEIGWQVWTTIKITHTSVGSATMTMTKDSSVISLLQKASTFEQDTRVRKCALKLQDIVLLAKLSAGDMIS